MVLSAHLAPDEKGRREALRGLLQELKIDSVVAHDAVNYDVVASRAVQAFALDDNDI